jgi:tetratricopeptide (TPR) repeat protein
MTDTQPIQISKLTFPHTLLIAGVLLLASYSIWWSIKPFLAERHYRDGYQMEAYERPEIAIEHYKRAAEYAPLETQYQMDLAKMYMDFGMSRKTPQEQWAYLKLAEDTCLNIIRLDERNPWFKNRLASIYLTMAQLNTAEAADYIEKAEIQTRLAAESDFKNPIFQLNVAFFLHRIGRENDAIPYYLKAIEFDSNMVEAYFNMADIYIKRGDQKSALQNYIKVAQINPDFNNINLIVSNFYLHTYSQSKDIKDLLKAIPYLEAQLTKNSGDLEVLQNLGAIYIQLKKWPEAAKIYGQALTFYPGKTNFYPFYAKAVVKSGDADRVLKELRTRIALNPNDPYLKQQIQLIEQLR